MNLRMLFQVSLIWRVSLISIVFSGQFAVARTKTFNSRPQSRLSTWLGEKVHDGLSAFRSSSSPLFENRIDQARLELKQKSLYGIEDMSQKYALASGKPGAKRSHRAESPCAGSAELPTHVGPTVATLNISPSAILEELGHEATKAKRTTKAILNYLEGWGIGGVAHEITNAPLVSFSLTTFSGNDRNVNAMLNGVYRELSKAASVIDKMAADENPIVGSLLESLKENGIYNILCGLKVVMEAEKMSLNSGGVSQVTDFPTLHSRAERITRDFIVLHRISALFNDVASQFTTLAIYI